MIETSQAFQQAITGEFRKVCLRAVLDLIGPDVTYTGTPSNSLSPWSRPGQLYDKDFAPFDRYATLERNRWLLDGSFPLYPDTPAQIGGQSPYLSQALCGADGSFSQPVWVGLAFANVSILQACSAYFSEDPADGVPDTFTVEVRQGGEVRFSQEFSGNRAASVALEGFTVYDPDEVRVVIRRWSLPFRRARVREIVAGLYAVWNEGDIAAFDLEQKANISCLALPYGTCALSMDNVSRRFEPRNKSGLFRSIEERQGIAVFIGVQLPDGRADYVPVGVYYQYNGGWRTGDNGIAMKWQLVDLIGLLATRQYFPPSELPTTLESWVASVVGQLGVNFKRRYTVDPGYAALPVRANSAEDVAGKTCGELLRYACMVTGTFPRADNRNGYVAVEPLWDQGNKFTLDNLGSYPVMKANSDLAAISFTLYGAEDVKTQYVVSGTSTASNDTVAVNNPFIHSEAQALTAARLILAAYGGGKIETTGRGDPTGEIGDVDTVWLDESGAASGRRLEQSFRFVNGLLRDCRSTLLQADGSLAWEGRAVLTESGTWTVPVEAGSSLRLIVVGGGSGSTAGTDGTWQKEGEPGTDGSGGMIWHGTVGVNPGQRFAVTIGKGGGPGAEGGATVFGPYSSANGRRYTPNFTDVRGGNAYGRSGVPDPLPNTGDGAAGGAAGARGNRHSETKTITSYDGVTGEVISSFTGAVTVIDNYPGEGGPGQSGADGCVVVYWDKSGGSA